jgi:hypothetical protein
LIEKTIKICMVYDAHSPMPLELGIDARARETMKIGMISVGIVIARGVQALTRDTKKSDATAMATKVTIDYSSEG